MNVIINSVECKNGYAVIAKVPNNTSAQVGTAINKVPKPFQVKVKTRTDDNGKEFYGHARIAETLSTTGFVARAFTKWERGTNENFKGMQRQYVFKKLLKEKNTNEKIK
ncbi:MAG TPA: hypothetical protein VIK56_01765 [Rhodoferax sp.]